jgi:hypothetical protein
MSKLKKCPECEQEVSKSAKVCPKCGKKLKMGFMLKGFIALIGIIILIVIAQPSPEEKKAKQQAAANKFENAIPENIDASALVELYSLNSKNTDLQRDKKEKEITGKIVQWNLKVYEVNERGTGYRIQTSSNSNSPGTFLNIKPRNDDERNLIESLTTGAMIKVKGKITGVLMRNIQMDPVVLAK